MADPSVAPLGTRLTSQRPRVASHKHHRCEAPVRRVVLSSSTAHAADSSRTFTSVLPLSLLSMPDVSATTVVSLMVRRITKTEIFPNVLGRLFLCVAIVDQYRNRCLLYTSLVCLGSFLHPSEDECVDLARREYSSPSAVKDASLFG